MQFLQAWISRNETVGATFCNIHQLTKRNLCIAGQTFIIEKMALFFFCKHAQNQCDIVKRTHFAMPTLDTVSDKNNYKIFTIQFAPWLFLFQRYSSFPIMQIWSLMTSSVGQAQWCDTKLRIGHFGKYHNTLCFSPQIFISIVFVFSWNHCKSQGKLQTMLMQNLGVQTESIMVLYGVAYISANTPFAVHLEKIRNHLH